MSIPELQQRAMELDKMVYIAILKEPATRREICNALKLPWSTAFDSLTRLEKKSLARRFTENRSIKGRPKVYWEATVPSTILERPEKKNESVFRT